MRILCTAVVAILSTACTTSRAAAVSRGSSGAGSGTTVGTPGPAPSAPFAPSGPRTFSGGATDAATLARETGLVYADDGRTVLLSNPEVRARLYPATGTLTIDGRGVPMGAVVRREGGLVHVPAAGADAVRRAVADASQRRMGAAMPVALTPLPPLAPVARPIPKTVDLAPVAVRDVSGEAAWNPPTAARGWRWIVGHHTDDHAGCFAKNDRVHRAKGWEGCGYHFVIGNGTESGDGEVEVTDRWSSQMHGAHAKTDDNRFNDYGVGIVLVGDFERGGQPTDRQYRALVKLTRWLMARYGVTPDRVLRHSDCKSTACPGKFFPWSRYIGDVSDAASMTSPP